MSKALKVIAGTPDRRLIIGNIEIPCYVLEDETRVLVQRGMAAGIGMSSPSGDRIGRFVSSKNINHFLSNKLKVVIDSPIRFQAPGGIAHGYPATLLVDLCNVVLAAREAGMLQRSQFHIAHRCETLIRGLATVGIIALVDEATGYERIKIERNLAIILERFIAKELQPWTKTFPFEFYEQIFRLKKWPGPDGLKGPRVIGRYTNDIVYERLAPGVLNKLRRKNPQLPSGRRRHKHHQWFTPEHGDPRLREHLAAVMAVMRLSPNWDRFMANLNRAFPKLNETIPLALED